MSSRDIIRKLEAGGWYHVKTVGDHFQYKHPVNPGKTTVPHPVKDMPITTLKSIERQSGMKLK